MKRAEVIAQCATGEYFRIPEVMPTKKAVMEKLRKDRISVSVGNSKLCSIANFNGEPGTTCSKEACSEGGCHGDCYACNSWRQYPNVREAWGNNTINIIRNLATVYEDLYLYLNKYKGEYFRIHSAGDFASEAYAWMWYHLAKQFPNIRFLAFTKQFDIVKNIPFNTLDNFSLRPSDGENWYAIHIPQELREKYKCASMVRHYSNAEGKFLCPGSCETCKECWYQNADVCFPIHGQGKHAK